ncbi:DUF6515 family protein [Kaarinaea lacus]
MITNRQKIFVKFITLLLTFCLAAVIRPIVVLASSSESKLQEPPQLFNKYRDHSKKVSPRFNRELNNNPDDKNDLWQRWQNKNDQHTIEQHNSKQKQAGKDRNHDRPGSNKKASQKQKKQTPNSASHQYHDRKTKSGRHDERRFKDSKHNSDIRHQPKMSHRTYERHTNKSKKHVTVKHRHKHKPKHHLYKRHKYVYYRTPWYNTRYLAPIHYHYHPIGHRVRHLPSLHISVLSGGFTYFYLGGVFYQSFGTGYIVVGAPIGVLVPSLPVGFIEFSIGPSSYYYVNDTYYVWDIPRQSYLVVEKPVGADVAIEEATTGRLFAYPKKDQSEEQQAKDRYECHRWAVHESGIDPTLEDAELSTVEKLDYQRALGACLEGRDYAVK